MINYEFPPLGGGGGVFTRDLAAELAKGHDVDVLTTKFSGLDREETSGNLTIHRVSVLARTSLHTATMLSMLTFLISGTIKGLFLLSRKKYDVLHTHFAVPTGPVGLMLSRIFRVPNIITVYGGDIYDPSKKFSPHRHALTRFAVRLVLNNASKIVAESNDIKLNALKFYKPSGDIAVIPLGIPETGFTRAEREGLSMKKDAFYLISIGRLVPRKGYDFLIKALALLRDRGKDINLLLLGDGLEKNKLKELAAKLRLRGRVTFIHSASDSEKTRYLAASDMYVLSSLHEGFGIVLLEAMFAGLPIVATSNGGQTDIIKDGVNGILVPPGDEKELACAIERLSGDRPLMDSIIKNNEGSAKKYSISAVSEKYELIYRELSPLSAHG